MARLSSVVALALAVAVPHAAAFFPPQPNGDPSLTPGPRAVAPTHAPVPTAPVVPAQAATQPAPQIEPPREATPPDPADLIKSAEEQMDRVERESDRVRANPPPAPIVGAFDGLTSERDR
jgi:hypothetical protein